MKRSDKQKLSNAITAVVAIAVIGLIFFFAAKYAPEDHFSDSAFVEDVSKMNRY